MGLFGTWELLKKAGHQGTIGVYRDHKGVMEVPHKDCVGLFERLPYENENWQQHKISRLN